ncbi:hypothetical protein DFH09DRAFT_1315492 [Mycena vulgaris]|nr:hypothetical protein DFH09DRAFT_1315492 [Mycena vulgaris]
MPAPYPLIEMPPGDFTNMFDYQAMCVPLPFPPVHACSQLTRTRPDTRNMAAAHNTFIQGINATVAHAPSVPPKWVQPFMVFSLAVVENIHHHHGLEETFLFPEMKKLGVGALSHNVAQHREGPGGHGALLVQMIGAFGDTMITHLNDEISSLESSRMRVTIEFATTLPLSVVCGNPATPWFPPFPLPLKWATRWWFARKQSAGWEFGPLDLYGNPRVQDGSRDH